MAIEFHNPTKYRTKTSASYSVGYSESVVSQTIGQPIPISRGYRLIKGQLLWSTSIAQETKTTTTDYYYRRVDKIPNPNTFYGDDGKEYYLGPLDPLPDDQTDIETTRLFVDCAIGFGQALNNDIKARIVQLRAGSSVLYSSLAGATAQLKSMGFTLYTGSEEQLPDPLMESYLGAGNVPAYRGEIYVVFKQLDLINFGGKFPDIYAVVADSGSSEYEYNEIIPTGIYNGPAAFDQKNELLYLISNGDTAFMLNTRKGRVEGTMHLDRVLGGLQANIAIAEWAGQVFGCGSSAGNVEPIHMLDIETGEWLSTFGFEAPASTASTPLRFTSQQFMIAQIVYGGDGKPPITFLVCAGLFNTLGLLFVDGATGVLTYCGHENGTAGAQTGVRGPAFKQASYVYLASDTVITEVILNKQLADRIPQVDGTIDFPTLSDGRYSDVPWIEYSDDHIRAIHYFAADDSLIVFLKSDASDDTVKKYDRASKALIWSRVIDNAGANQSKWRAMASIQGGFITWTAGGNVYSIDCVTGEYSGNEGPLDDIQGVNNDSDYFFDLNSGRFIAWATDHSVGQFLGAGVLGSRVALATILAEIGEFVGVDGDSFVIDERIDDFIDGFILQESSGADFLSMIRAIGQAFGFSITESGDGIKITKDAVITGNEEPAIALTKSDLGLLQPSDFPVNTNDPFSNAGVVSTRKPDYDIADYIKITYSDIDYDFAPNTASQVRNKLPFQIRRKGRDVAIDIPFIIMRTNEASTLAANLLFQAISNRIQHEFRLKPKVSRLEPGDVVTVPAADHVLKCKLLSVVYHMDFSLSCLAEDYLNNDQGLVDPGGTPITPPIPGVIDNVTRFIPIDMPEFDRYSRVTGDKISLFYAIGGVGQDNWQEAAVLRSDDGAIYQSVTKIQRASVYGRVVQTLNNLEDGPFGFDETSVMTFYLTEGKPSDLVTQPMNAWLALQRPAIVGIGGRWEYISIREFDYDENTGLFTCSGFLRGLNDTYMNANKRREGEYIVFPYLGGGYRRLIEPISLQDHSVYYKGVGTGESSSTARAYIQNLGAEAQRPMSVLNVRAKKNTGDDDIVFTWNRQSILNLGLLDGPDTDYLEFATEAYRIDILDAPDGAVTRTANITTPIYTYSTADQTADGFTPGTINTLSVLVTQLSDEFGDGRTFERLVDIS